MNALRETPMPEPAVLKTAEGDDYTDDTGAKWAWFAHGYDTGMEPFFSVEQLRAVQVAAWNAAIEAAAVEAEQRAENVRKANTNRGRVGSAASFAADQIEFAASTIRALKELAREAGEEIGGGVRDEQ